MCSRVSKQKHTCSFQASPCSTLIGISLAKLSQTVLRGGEDHTAKGKGHGVGTHYLGPFLKPVYYIRLVFVFTWRV